MFLVAMLNVKAFAMAASSANPYDQMSESISRAMGRYFTPGIMLLLLSALLLLIIAAILHETHRSKKLRQAMTALAMAKFDVQAEKLNLRLSNIAILKKIVQKSKLQDSSSIMKFSHVFESSLEKFYESEKIESMSNEMLAQISDLRKELGFSPLPGGIAITSTRQFYIGDKCKIQILENDSTFSGTCYVIDSSERQWAINRPEGYEDTIALDGTWVNMSLTRQGDAEYTFKAQVLADSNEQLALRHTSKLDRTQQRNWLRIDVNIPVNVTIMTEPDVGDILSGKIIDISGGGLRMALPNKLLNNSTLLLNFELPELGQIVDLLGNVVRVAGPLDGSNSKIVHSVTFANEVDLGHEKIMKYIFKKQRESLFAR
jgi:c-di-GMP-binding flagellar brake protein YcgR